MNPVPLSTLPASARFETAASHLRGAVLRKAKRWRDRDHVPVLIYGRGFLLLHCGVMVIPRKGWAA